jgi:hypothetical protein
MIRTVDAIIDAHGRVQLLEPVALKGGHRALVTILEEVPTTHPHETALWSEWRLPTGAGRRRTKLGHICSRCSTRKGRGCFRAATVNAKT